MYSNSLFFTHHTLKTEESLMDSSSSPVPVDFYYSTKPAGDNNNNNFIIDDLLDFSNEEDDTLLNDDDNNNTFHHSINGNSTDSTVTAVDSCNSSLSGHFDVSQHSFPDVPYDDMAELEWLSNFVEESFSSEEDIHKLNLISGVKTDVISDQQQQTRNVVNNDNDDDDDNSPNQHHPIFRSEITVPGKARSKRARIAPCNWSSRLLAVTPSPATSEASETDYIPFNSGKKPLKIHRKKDNLVSDGRRCLHCATDKTPQWRTGPLGPKTLCNACGVRFKSGRLVPEYRPANSPTFMLSKHSNSHRKVMEMRRQKEMQRSQREQFLYAPMFDVSGCADEYLIHHDTGSDFSQLI